MFVLIRNWWALVLRGIIAFLFAALALLEPAMALLTLVYLFGFYAIADGVFNLIAAFRRTPDLAPWWALFLEGLLGIIAGSIAFLLPPAVTAVTLLYLIAAWALVTGTLEIAAAICLRKRITGEWALALAGALSITLGILFILFPAISLMTLVLSVGTYALLFGILMISFGLRLRSWIRREESLGFPGILTGH